MSMRVYRAALAAAAFSVVAAGCDRGDTLADPATTTTATTPAHSDDQLATYVEARYQTDPSIASSDIEVTARDGVVTLHGSVTSDAAREHAVTLARQMDGVRSVDDQLRVEPATNPAAIIAPARDVESGATAAAGDREDSQERSPAWITTKIQSQYFIDTEVKPWNVDVTTRRDGTVTLRGEVDNAAAREAAERIARQTDGVTRVVNQLRVEGEREEAAPARGGNEEQPDRTAQAETDLEHPDTWLTAKVQAKFFMDREVKGRNIDVDTQDGVVTLTGEVETPAQRRQAVALANNTEGVRSVNDQLRLEAATDADQTAAAGTSGRSNERVVEDAWITTIVQSKFFLDGDIKGRDINVDTRNGIVTLQGEVENETEKLAAQAIAEETDGVGRVVNQLAVIARGRQ